MENKLNELFLEIERIKLNIGRIESHISSESGTLSREAKRLNEEIKNVDKKVQELFYDSEDGFIVRMDRLMKESERREKTWNNIIALWITIGGVIIKIFWDWFNSKK